MRPARLSASAGILGATLALALSSPALANPQPVKAPAFAVPPALAAVMPGADLPDIAERAVASVVNISSTKRASARGMDPMLRRFFGPGRPGPNPRGGALGSGVVVSADGLVLTNNHVVEGASAIRVALSDGRELDAEIVGTDPKTDLAVLRLEGDLEGIPPMPIGDSEQVRLAEPVLAIGNPFGLGHTVTMGIVSATGRMGMGIVDYEDFIQTDAAINPGNSGGALINLRGELIGINTAILSRSGGYQGVGFAIPSQMAQGVMSSLVQYGKVTRGWLGVGIQDLDARLARGLGLPEGTDGVLITGVMPDTPAARAGLARGDVITALDGARMTSASALRNTIAMKGADIEVDLEVLRDGRERSVAVTLGTLPDEAGMATRRAGQGAKDHPRVGVSLRPLDPEMRERLGVDGGLLVRGVDPGSPAARAGLRPGDVILEAGRKSIESVDAFKARLESGGELVLLVQRRGGSSFLVLEVPKD